MLTMLHSTSSVIFCPLHPLSLCGCGWASLFPASPTTTHRDPCQAAHTAGTGALAQGRSAGPGWHPGQHVSVPWPWTQGL